MTIELIFQTAAIVIARSEATKQSSFLRAKEESWIASLRSQ
jgi:hypothetical protein